MSDETKKESKMMGAQFAVFNGHVNDATKKAKLIMAETMPTALEELEKVEEEGGGIMAIFDNDPSQSTLMFVGMVTALVNLEHVVLPEEEKVAL